MKNFRHVWMLMLVSAWVLGACGSADTAAPVVTAPVAVTLEATAILTPVTLGAASVTDNVDTNLVITNDAPAAFPMGVSTVTYRAADAAGNVGTATQTVNITDTTVPVMTAPVATRVDTTGNTPVSINIGAATATDIFAVTITNDAPATFPIGVSSVTWTAMDANGNSVTATQLVTVNLANAVDTDGDGVIDSLDAFSNDPAASVDTDGDGYPNSWNTGKIAADSTSVPRLILDVFPQDVSEWADLDGDGIGDNTDPDRDGDGFSNVIELQAGTDPNNAASVPADLDGDGVIDILDAFSNDPSASVDTDGDGYPNSWNTGNTAADSTSVPRLILDVFPQDVSEWADLDGDGIGDNADPDRDGDGFSNVIELQAGTDPNSATSVPPDMDGDGIPDSIDPDMDGDGIPNTTDAFPSDPYRSFTLPNLRITSPQTLTTVASSPVQLVGTLDDPNAALTINGISILPNTAGSFQASVALQAGNNTILARAVDAAGHEVTDFISVYFDQTPPYMTITMPSDGQVVRTASISVGGLVNDIIRGTISASQANVTVNGVIATVNNRSYEAQGVSLVPGNNVITVSGSDQVGNASSVAINVVYEPVVGAHIATISGQNQTANIKTGLTNPVVVQLLDVYSQPVANKNVVFRVVQGDGKLGAVWLTGGNPAMEIKTDSLGKASAYFSLGSRAGAGNHRVRATAVGFDGEIIFTASATPNPGNKLSVNSGNNQRGAAGMTLGLPFVTVVTDEGGNVVANAAVEFKMVAGGGQFDNGTSVFSTVTDSDGRASARFRLGFKPGMDTHRVIATLVGSIYTAGFTASALIAGDPALTRVSGLVLDNQDNALPGVTVRVDGLLQRMGVTDVYGQFTITQVPVGPVHLIAEGATTTVAGEWPTLSHNIITVAGANNTLPAPIYMVKLDTANAITIGATDVDYTVASIPGFKLHVKAGSVTFPDGSKTGQISVTAVNASKVPMSPPNGMQPQLIVTIQPVGAVFDPPAALSLPNVDGHAPGAEVEMYSFDHDLEEFVSIGLGTVSVDGSVIESNPGVGVVKAGWHCGSQPAGDGDVCSCSICHKCSSGACIPMHNEMQSTCVACRNGSPSNLPRDTATSESCVVCNGAGGTMNKAENSICSDYAADGTAFDGACNIGICVPKGQLAVTSSPNPGSAQVHSFIVDSYTFPSSYPEVRYVGQLSAFEKIEWRIEALASQDNLPLRRAYGGIGEVVDDTGVSVPGGIVPPAIAAATGAYGDPWVSVHTKATTIRFKPNPPAHATKKYHKKIGGTKAIDVYQKNPRLGYRVEGKVFNGIAFARSIPAVILRMDEIDMLRQEYVTHLVSAPASANDVKIPRRAEIVLESSLRSSGYWGSYSDPRRHTGYPYKYIVNNGMVTMWQFYEWEFKGIPKDVPLIDPYATQRLIDPYTTPAFPAKGTLAVNQTVFVTSAYRNPERNEKVGGKQASRHMLGRALDITVHNIGGYGTYSRGTAFYKVWEAIHRLSSEIVTYNPTRITGSRTTAGNSTSVPWADRWALETGGSKEILVSSVGFVINALNHSLDANGNGVLDGYERAGHLHVQDNPRQGVHQ